MVQASVYASIGTLIDLAESPPPHQSSCLSISRKLLKKALNISRPVAKSSTPIISRTCEATRPVEMTPQDATIL
eukprot:6032132-Pleurochrysis_carterae.AAC.5